MKTDRKQIMSYKETFGAKKVTYFYAVSLYFDRGAELRQIKPGTTLRRNKMKRL